MMISVSSRSIPVALLRSIFYGLERIRFGCHRIAVVGKDIAADSENGRVVFDNENRFDARQWTKDLSFPSDPVESPAKAGKIYPDCCAVIYLAVDIDDTVILLDDPEDGGHPEPGPLPPFFRGEERLEDL